jgi:hypothetical protein
MKNLLILFTTTIISTIFCSMISHSQTVIPLYADSIPNSKPHPDEENSKTDNNGRVSLSLVSRPALTVYLPPAGTANGTGVIVVPGGGYHHEGCYP